MRRALSGLAVVVAAAVLVLFGGSHWRAQGEVVNQSYTAAPDAVRAIKLPDGTLVQLGKASLIEVRFDGHHRRIDMVRGNALFDVGKDPARPMLVSVGGHVLQDIGTVFDVRRDAGSDTLTVLSGRVRVWNGLPARSDDEKTSAGSPLPSGDTVADLVSGQQVELRDSGAGPIHAAQVAQATSWLPEDIRFQHETVSDVARRFNAYTTRPLVIEGERIADMRISGVLHANDPKAFIAYLATLPDVRIVQGTDRVRVIALSSHGKAKAEQL